MVDIKCGVSRGAQPLLLEDDTCGPLTYYAFPVGMDGSAHKDEEMKKLRNIISLYERGHQ